LRLLRREQELEKDRIFENRGVPDDWHLLLHRYRAKTTRSAKTSENRENIGGQAAELYNAWGKWKRRVMKLFVDGRS
jgi:hypothetical protein